MTISRRSGPTAIGSHSGLAAGPTAISRRDILRLGGLAAATLAVSGCESLEQRLTRIDLPSDALSTGVWSQASPALRLLHRAGYGPRPGDIAHVERLGQAAYLAEQLAPETIAEPAALTFRTRALMDVLDPDTGLLFDEDDHRIVSALRQATILRAVYSRRQLYERTVEFWSDHFNIYAFKGQGPQLAVVDNQTTIRAHAFGRFRDLLAASARSAAMLGYLDNAVNRRGMPNENYARELMELHTLGVHGGYTQRDVHEVARCLTGWTSEKHWRRGRFLFDGDAHDDGRKVVLGQVIEPGGGIADGERVLNILANHPATATHLATKMCRFYLGHAPETVVKDVAATYTRTSGSVRAMLRTLLTENNLASAPSMFKRPYDYVISSMRALNADTDGGRAVQDHLEKMGQLPFGWPMPNGYPLEQRSWIGGLVPRWNFALSLASSGIENSRPGLDAIADAAQRSGIGDAEALLKMAFGTSDADAGIAALREKIRSLGDPREYAAMVLMSPQFQWR